MKYLELWKYLVVKDSEICQIYTGQNEEKWENITWGRSKVAMAT